MRLRNYSKTEQRVSITLCILVGVIRYLCRSVTISSSEWRAECPIYQASTQECAGDDVADTPRHPDDVACAMSPSNEVRRVVWPLGTRLASDLGRARQKCLSVPYGELAYVTRPHEWRIIVAQWGKNLDRVKNDLSFEWEWCIYVQLVFGY